MVYAVLIIFFIGLLGICYLIGRFVLHIFGYKHSYNPHDLPPSNPYIERHKTKLKNDSDYESYLLWMQKNKVLDAPIDKNKQENEKDVDDSIRELFNR